MRWIPEFSKKVIFLFDLGIGMSAGEVGPGDSVSVNPVVTNSATEDMYVFVKIQMPEWDGSPLYTFRADDAWTLVESEGGAVIYAYANPEMTVLSPSRIASDLFRMCFTTLAISMNICAVSEQDRYHWEEITFLQETK